MAKKKTAPNTRATIDKQVIEARRAVTDKYLATTGAKSKSIKKGEKTVKKPVAPVDTNNKAWRAYRARLAALRRPDWVE